MSILIFISESSILPIKKEVFEKNPITVFTLFYQNSEIQYILPFSMWLNKYIISESTLNLGEKAVENKIQGILSSSSKIKRLTLKLFPFQVECTKKNWDAIRKEMNRVYYRKRLRYLDTTSYESFENSMNKNLEVVLDV